MADGRGQRLFLPSVYGSDGVYPTLLHLLPTARWRSTMADFRYPEEAEMDMKPETQGDAVLTLLFSRETVAVRVRQLGEQISRDYAGKEILLIGVLKGAFVFLADLMRTLEVAVQVEFVRSASYGTETTSGGHVRVTHDLEVSIAGRHVLVIEDILDTGLTLSFLL